MRNFQEIEVPQELAGIMAFVPPKRVIVNSAHMMDHQVRSWIAEARRHGHELVIEPGTIDLIAAARKAAVDSGQAKGAGKAKTSDSLNQKKAVNLVTKAVGLRASDIHISTILDRASIQMRVDGLLREVEQWEADEALVIMRALFQSMANIGDITFNQNIMQDARIARSQSLPEEVHGIRIATTPLDSGFKMALRLLYSQTQGIRAIGEEALSLLGYSKSHIAAFSYLMRKPFGISIICGITGSGKSTTLKYVLEWIAHANPGLHVLTVEDPPEYPIAGTYQIPVSNVEDDDNLRHLAFSKAIRGAMRLDPDVIMVGEVRDEASAMAAFRAGMTGHQVWTTLHANPGFGGLQRLLDLGVDMSLVSDHNIVNGVMYQRLAPLLCPHCSLPFVDHSHLVNPQTLNRLTGAISEHEIHDVRIRNPEGCEKCDHSGVRGRTVLAEVAVFSPQVMDRFRSLGAQSAFEEWRLSGGKTIVDHAIEKISAGLIDPELTEAEIGPLTNSITAADFME